MCYWQIQTFHYFWWRHNHLLNVTSQCKIIENLRKIAIQIQFSSKLIGLISLKISANLYVLPTDILLNFCQNRIEILWKIKINKQIQNQFPIRAYVKAPWRHPNFGFV